MDKEHRKNLRGIVGEFLDLEQQMASVEGSCRNFITELLQTSEASVEFKPSPYWEKKIKSGRPGDLEEALEQESEHVVIDCLSEEDPTDQEGYLLSIVWDKKNEDVIANVYVNKQHKARQVHFGDIKNVSRVLRFIDAFA